MNKDFFKKANSLDVPWHTLCADPEWEDDKTILSNLSLSELRLRISEEWGRN